MPHTIVVGAGLIGMLTARELSEGGMSVTLLDKGSRGRESSWAGGGILSPLYPWRYPDPITELARWGQPRYEALCSALADATGIDPEWTRSGMLMVDVDGEERRRAEGWAERFGYRLERLSAAALADSEPGLEPGLSALWMPDVAQVRNPRLLQSLGADLDQRGVRVVENCKVTGFRVESGRVTGVLTSVGVQSADVVLVAGGAWSGRLLEASGLRLAVEPVRGQMLLYRGDPGMVQHIVLADDHYIIPRRDGRILVGSTMERVGFEKITTQQALTELRGVAESAFPALGAVAIEAHWAGLRPGSPQGVPFIGAHPALASLYINAGHFRNGVVMGMASARLAADLVLGRPPILDAAAYRP